MNRVSNFIEMTLITTLHFQTIPNVDEIASRDHNNPRRYKLNYYFGIN